MSGGLASIPVGNHFTLGFLPRSRNKGSLERVGKGAALPHETLLIVTDILLRSSETSKPTQHHSHEKKGENREEIIASIFKEALHGVVMVTILIRPEIPPSLLC